jgi:hypothetical protein
MTTITLQPGESYTLPATEAITVTAAPIVVPPPVDPPPVEPPPNGIEVPVGTLKAKLAAAKDGDVFLLRGGDHAAPFLISKRKVTIQNWPGEVPVLTTPGRPDLLYLENDAVVRGITFRSQSTGFDDSQGAALSEVRSPSNSIGLVWYDGCTFIGTSKMATREQLLYIAEKSGHGINEVRVTNCTFDGAGTKGYGIHPYSGPTPKAVNISGSTFRNFATNAAVLNAANACLVKVDRCTFENTVTYARGMYGPVQVSNSKLSGNAIGTVQDMGGNTR